MDSRLRPSSKASSDKALKYWRPICEREGWDEIIETDDPARASKMAVFVMSLCDDTNLTYTTIRNYTWGLRTWHIAQRHADPTLGVMHWEEFMDATDMPVAVLQLLFVKTAFCFFSDS